MFSRIIAVIMCIFSVFSAPFSQFFTKAELKNELAKGSYESPYIVRPLNGITVNGISLDEYSVAALQEITVKDFSSLLFGDIFVSKNKAIFKTRISS